MAYSISNSLCYFISDFNYNYANETFSIKTEFRLQNFLEKRFDFKIKKSNSNLNNYNIALSQKVVDFIYYKCFNEYVSFEMCFEFVCCLYNKFIVIDNLLSKL